MAKKSRPRGSKKFGKKYYNPFKTFEKKSDAVKYAKNLRKKGELVRVIPKFTIYRKKIKKK